MGDSREIIVGRATSDGITEQDRAIQREILANNTNSRILRDGSYRSRGRVTQPFDFDRNQIGSLPIQWSDRVEPNRPEQRVTQPRSRQRWKRYSINYLRT